MQKITEILELKEFLEKKQLSQPIQGMILPLLIVAPTPKIA